MSVYALGDLVVDSELPLVELPPTGADRVDVVLRRLDAPPDITVHTWLFDSRLDDGRIWMACARHGAGYLIRFPDFAEFVVSRDGRDIAVFGQPDTPAETIRHLFLDQVFPLALSLRGELALHAAAVATPSGAAAFLGETGYGKSTIAASFVQAGFPLLSDDCLLVREHDAAVVALPSYPGLRLWPDAVASLSIDTAGARAVAHYSQKRRVLLTPSAADCRALPLTRIYVLAPDDAAEEVSIVPLSRRETLIELLTHAYRLELDERRAVAAELDRVDLVSRACPIRRLRFPWAFASLPHVRDAVLEDLRVG
jgi:hypothetical protein